MEKLVLRDKKTGNIINRDAKYPRANLNEPVKGLDENLEYLMYYEPSPKPTTYDSRVYNLEIVEEPTKIPHPIYNNFNQYRVTYNLAKKIQSEVEEQIREREFQANKSIIRSDRFSKLVILTLGILVKQANGKTISQKEELIKSKALSVALNVWKNDTVLRNKLNELTQGTLSDIDSNWEETDSGNI